MSIQLSRIAVLGASVSAQSVEHLTGVVTGYTEMLRRNHLGDIGASDLRRFTYAGNRLSEGGLIQLSEVLDWAPDVCIVEPLIEDVSRGVPATDDEIMLIYASLVNAGILPVTLMLPIPEQRHPRFNPEFTRFDSFCSKHNLPTIIVDLTEFGPLEGRFSGVHTTRFGAPFYVEKVIAGLNAIDDPRQRLSTVRDLPNPEDVPVYIAKIDNYSHGAKEGEARLQLLSKTSNSVKARLVQKHLIGPHSPVIEFQVSTANRAATCETISIWDPYCHFERESFATLAFVTLENGEAVDVEIKISDLEPNYALSRKEPQRPWPEAGECELRPLSDIFVISNGILQTS